MRHAIDVSFLPALAAAFMLAFARIGTMVMLLPGLGEFNIPVRVKLVDRAAADRSSSCRCIAPPIRSTCSSFAPLLVLMVQEIMIGIVLGATARRDALGAAGRGLGHRPADGARLRHRGRSDPGPAGRDGRQFPHPARRHAAVRDRHAIIS